LRAIALLVAAGFAGGLLLQWKAPGEWTAPVAHKPPPKKKLVAQQQDDDDEDDGEAQAVPIGGPGGGEGGPRSGVKKLAPDEMERKMAEAERKAAMDAAVASNKASAEKTPSTLGKFAAIAAVLDNSIKVTDQIGHTSLLYFSSRGMVVDLDGETAVGRIWKREDDRLCQTEDPNNKKCFTLTVKLDSRLQEGPAAQLQNRLDSLPIGAKIGTVDGLGGSKATLVRGNVGKIPDYLPLLDAMPGDPLMLSEKPNDKNAEPSFIGSLLVQSRRDEDRAVTFFAPWGHLVEATREADTREIVHYWFGGWRRVEDLVCRDLKVSDARRVDQSVAAQECAHPRATKRVVDFPEAPPGRRNYQRQLWPGESIEEAETPPPAAPAPAPIAAKAEPARSAPTPQAGGPSPASPGEKPRPSAFMDLR
jgi:hypothetical protein